MTRVTAGVGCPAHPGEGAFHAIASAVEVFRDHHAQERLFVAIAPIEGADGDAGGLGQLGDRDLLVIVIPQEASYGLIEFEPAVILQAGLDARSRATEQAKHGHAHGLTQTWVSLHCLHALSML